MRFPSRFVSAFIAATALAASNQTLSYADPSPSPAVSPSIAMPPTMEAPSPPPAAAKPTCPDVSVFTSRDDGKTYVVAFSDHSVYSGTVAMTIYTATKTYAANVPIAIALPGHASDYRSLPFTIANPVSEPFVAAEITFAGTRVVGGCVARLRLSSFRQDDVDVREAFAGLDPSRPPTQLLKVIGEGSTLTCKDPYADAQTDVAARLDYPAIAREMGQTGTAFVKVTLTDTGAVDSVALYRSSGSDYLDRAALNAAQQSHYRPQLFRCEPAPGSYLFRAQFEMRGN
jgi:TonB family protein